MHDDDLIGWGGASFDPQSVFGQGYDSGCGSPGACFHCTYRLHDVFHQKSKHSVCAMFLVVCLPKDGRVTGICRPVKVSDQPLAYVWKGFISRDEAKHIAQLAAPRLRQSLVGDGQASSDVCALKLLCILSSVLSTRHKPSPVACSLGGTSLASIFSRSINTACLGRVVHWLHRC